MSRGLGDVYKRQELALYMQRIERTHNAIQQELDKLSAIQQSRVVLPWVNGKLYDLYTWNLSYQMVINKIVQEMNKL